MKFYKDIYIQLNKTEIAFLEGMVNSFIDSIAVKHMAERFGVSEKELIDNAKPLNTVKYNDIVSKYRVYRTEENKDSIGWSEFESAVEYSIGELVDIHLDHLEQIVKTQTEKENEK